MVVDKIYVTNQNGEETGHDIGADAKNVRYTYTSVSETVENKIAALDNHAAKKIAATEVHGLRVADEPSISGTSNKILQIQENGQQLDLGGGSGSGDMTKQEYTTNTGDKPIKIEKGGTGNTVGYIQTGRADNTPIGLKATAEGNNTRAKGDNSHAEGELTYAYAGNSHSEGRRSGAIGSASHAEGTCVSALSDNDISSLDVSNYITGGYGFAYGVAAHSEGRECQAVGDYSHAEGSRTQASGYASHAEGYGDGQPNPFTSAGIVTASGQASHAEGINTVAKGDASHAEGQGTCAQGYGGHAEGTGTQAFGNYSHAEGYGTKAEGHRSHAEGQNTIAKGDYSHAGGFNVGAGGETSFIYGKRFDMDPALRDSTNFDSQFAFVNGDDGGTKFGVLNTETMFSIITSPFQAGSYDSRSKNGGFYYQIDGSATGSTLTLVPLTEPCAIYFITAAVYVNTVAHSCNYIYVSQFNNTSDPILVPLNTNDVTTDFNIICDATAQGLITDKGIAINCSSNTKAIVQGIRLA